MAYLPVLLFIIVIFVQPQEFWQPLLGVPLVAFTMGIAGAGWIFDRMGKKRTKLLAPEQTRLMIIFWGLVVFSAVFVGWKAYIITTFIDWGKWVLIYLIIVDTLDSPKKIRTVMFVMVAGMLFTAFTAIQQYYGHDITGRGIGWLGRIRGIGIFDTNQLAYTCVYMVPLSLALLRLGNPLMKLLAVAAIPLFYYCVFLTGSRGGMLAGAMFFMLIFIAATKSKVARIAGMVLSWGLLAAFMALAPRLQSLSDYQTDSSAMGRVSAWGEALINLKSAPLGIGKDMFEDTFKIAPHSSYIQVVSEIGILGLFVWIALFFYSIRNLKIIIAATRNKNREHFLLAGAMQTILYLYLIGSIFSGNGYYITLYILLAVTVALQNTCGLPEFAAKRRIFSIKDILTIGVIEIGTLGAIHVLSKTSG